MTSVGEGAQLSGHDALHLPVPMKQQIQVVLDEALDVGLLIVDLLLIQLGNVSPSRWKWCAIISL